MTDDGSPLSAAEARRRWDAYRADVWRVNAQVRGERGKALALALVPPGSWRHRAVVKVVEPLLVLRRRVRPSTVATTEFPLGVGDLVARAVSNATGAPARTTATVTVVELARAPGGGVGRTVVTEGDAGAAVAAVNDAVASAVDWVVVLDHADIVTADDLDEMRRDGEARGADLVYGDEVELDGGRSRAVLRTAKLGPLGLLSHDMTGRVVLFRTASLRARGGFDLSDGWAFRDGAVMRAVEGGALCVHVARVVALSTAHDRLVDVDRTTLVARTLRRRGDEQVAVQSTRGVSSWRAPAPPQWPRITVVIPTRDRLDLLIPCLRALEERTTYPDYEVVIVDNDSVEPATRAYLANGRYRVVAAPGPFNYAAIVNRGVGATDSAYVVTLNNDVTVETNDWLEQMVAVALMVGVGVVGCYLGDPDGGAQHEGIAIAPYPQNLRRERNYPVPDALLESAREVAAVTGACQLVSRALWDELGGLDEALAVVHNDVDFCLRAWRANRSVVYLPSVRHVHAESSSRGSLVPDEDIVAFVARWDVFGSYRDPWFPEQLEMIGDVVRWRADLR